ncbi:MAG: hypothetical protein KGQ51_08485 [Planctomycetes bacterium]|nr:hypothetical protein [Planctomycetota bacterium]
MTTVRLASVELSTGDIVGICSYILKFRAGLDTIPYALEKLATLRDIARNLTSRPNMSPSPYDHPGPCCI